MPAESQRSGVVFAEWWHAVLLRVGHRTVSALLCQLATDFPLQQMSSTFRALSRVQRFSPSLPLEHPTPPLRTFLPPRINSGIYDEEIPGDYTYQTNIYWWDGMYQIMPSMTRWIAAIYNNEQFRNNTDMFVVRQIDSGVDAAVVTVCIASQSRERSCNDGLDNDCDGMIDDQDPDCNPDAEPQPAMYSVGDGT